MVELRSPVVDCGAFAAKASIGAPTRVVADVFGDGHDLVAAALHYRHEDDSASFETPMETLGNDAHVGSFLPDRPGYWSFEVSGWVDHFSTALHGIRKKVDAGVDVALELMAMRRTLSEMHAVADGDDAVLLAQLASSCARGEPDELLALPGLTEVAFRTQPRRPVSTSETVAVFVDRERARFSAWYELFPRSLGGPDRHGTLRDVEDQLDRVASMGFDVLYLPPIHPIGTTARKGPDNSSECGPGDPGSPWAIGAAEGGHCAVHPQLGTPADVERLGAACAGRGIDLALDLAFQCSPDHPWVSEHPEWFARRADGSIQYAENPPKKYQDIYPLDFGTDAWESLWEALHGVVRFWADRGVRVFRVDNPHTKSFGFWQWLLETYRRSDPDLIFLSEAFTRPRVMERLAKIGFQQSYTYFTWRTEPHEIREYFTDLTLRTGTMLRPNVWPNTPDILHEQLQTGGRAAFVVRAVLASMLSANWGVYGPPFELQEHEALREGSEEYAASEKYQLRDWDLGRSDSLEPLLKRLNAIRRAQPAMQHDSTLRFHNCDDPAMLAWSKTDPNGHGAPVLVVAAADPGRDAVGEVDIDWAQLGLAYDADYELTDHLGGGSYRWHGARNYVELSPQGLAAHVFTVEGPRAVDRGTPPQVLPS